MEGEEKKVKRKNETGGGGARGRGKQGRRGNENVDLLSCIPRGRVRPNTRGRNIERFPFRLCKFTWSSVHFLFDLFSTSVPGHVIFIREHSLLVLGNNTTTFLSTTRLVASFRIVLQPRPFSVNVYIRTCINIFLNRLSSGN